MKRIRVLLADDYQDMIQKITELLESDLEVVGSVGDGHSLMDAIDELRPDVAVVDVSMPRLNGLEAARRLKESGSEVKVVFLTVHTDPETVRQAFEAGGLGFVAKFSMASDLLPAIREVLAGRSFVSDLGFIGDQSGRRFGSME